MDDLDWRLWRPLARGVKWTGGVWLSSARWLRRLPRIERLELPAPTRAAPDPDRDLPGQAGTVQRRGDGAGEALQRRYRVRIAGARMSPEELIDAVANDLNAVAPVEIAEFERLSGEPGALRPGDELVVRMPGPWNAPVRVVERDRTAFRFVTLDGHMEAGEIAFEAFRDGDELHFVIESFARPGDGLFALLYERVGIAREMQLHMWVHVCERAAVLAGGRVVGKVQVATARLQH